MNLINDHHLLPLLADWTTPPKLILSWDTEVEPSLRGYEARAAKRQWPRATLQLVADVRRPRMLGDLRGRLAEALRVDHFQPEITEGKTGRVCVPWAGRESWAASQPSFQTVVLDGAHWPWKEGDWLIRFAVDETSFEVAQVSAVEGTSDAGQTLTLATGIAIEPPGDSAIYPLFFGRIAELPLELSLDNPLIGSVPIQVISERYEVDVNAWPLSGEGEPGGAPILPVASFIATASACREATCDASASTCDPDLDIAGYEWDFGDGEQGEGSPIVHTYQREGTYTITLTVRDSRGRRAADAQEITVLACEGDTPSDDQPPVEEEPPEDPADPAPLPPEDQPPPPEDYPYPGETTSSGDPIYPPSFGA